MRDFHDKALHPKFFEFGFHPIIRGLSTEYGLAACSQNIGADLKHLGQILRLAIRLETGIRHLQYEERLQRRRLQFDMITAFQMLTGLLDVDHASMAEAR